MNNAITRSVVASLMIAVAPLATADHHGDLMKILDARNDDAKARDVYRHPAETLQLFGIDEGMTVIDALPGSWYGDILAPAIGESDRMTLVFKKP